MDAIDEQMQRWRLDAQVPVGRNVFEQLPDFKAQFASLGRKSLSAYTSRHIKEVLRQCDAYGLEHRLPMNLTPLMAAAMVGNVALVEALIERGADREATDHFGWNALHWAMLEAFHDPKFAQGPFAALYDLLAPVERVTGYDTHIPLFRLEMKYLPSVERIVAAAKRAAAAG